MKKGQLGSYDIMVVSKYFETIEDFIHVELASTKARGNMEKFHFNPIPLDSWSRQFWTSLQTFHLYSENDEKFDDEEFYKRIIHCDVDYQDWLKKKDNDNVIYKSVVLNDTYAKSVESIPEGVTKIGKECFSYRTLNEMVIPDHVTSIDDYCYESSNKLSVIRFSDKLREIGSSFMKYNNLIKEIVLPDSVTSIGGFFLESCRNLTAMTIPTHWNQVGDKFVNNRPFFSMFEIPSSVETINGKEVVIEEVKEFDIPSYVTKLVNGCFRGSNFTKITIPTTIKELPNGCFYECHK